MYVLGIDIGSTACKGVVMDENKNIVASAVIPSGTGTCGPRKLVAELTAACGIE